MNSNPKKRISMVIDMELYRKSKDIITNRTADYQDYLRRRVYTRDRPELLKMEIEDLKAREKQVRREYDIELNILERQSDHDKAKQNDLNATLKTVKNIMESSNGVIGLDKLEIISNIRGVSLAELKNVIPQDKIVPFHPQFKEKVGRFR